MKEKCIVATEGFINALYKNDLSKLAQFASTELFVAINEDLDIKYIGDSEQYTSLLIWKGDFRNFAFGSCQIYLIEENNQPCQLCKVYLSYETDVYEYPITTEVYVNFVQDGETYKVSFFAHSD